MPRWHRERVIPGRGTAGGDAPGFSTGGRTAAPGQSTRWVGDKPLCHRRRCSGPGMSVLITVCPCHPPQRSCPHLAVPVTPVPLFPTTCPHSLPSPSSPPPCPHPVAQPEPPQGWPGPARGDLGPSRSGSGPAVLLQGYFWAVPPVPCLSQPGLWGQPGAGTAQGHGSGVTCPPPRHRHVGTVTLREGLAVLGTGTGCPAASPAFAAQGCQPPRGALPCAPMSLCPSIPLP